MKARFLLAVSALLCCCLPFVPARAAKTVRIGTYNLRIAVLDAKSPVNNWDARCGRLIQSLRDGGFDLCGLQEVDGPEQESIPRMMAQAGENYGFYFFNPYAEDGVGSKDWSKAHGLMWRKDRFEVGEFHYFWVSDPPEKMQINDVGRNGKGKLKRGGFCVIVKDLWNHGARYFIMVSHSALNREQRARFAHVYIDMERKWNPEGLPSFFVGDLNANEEDASSQTYRTWWTDSYHYFDSKPSRRSGSVSTFNGWDLQRDLTDIKRRIDFIYFRGRGIKPLRYVSDDTRYNGLYASDHFPVHVDFKIRKR